MVVRHCPNLPVLLAARILQGAVAGPLIPLSQAILLGSYPKEKSSHALSLWAMTATVGPIVGPALGSWITDSYSWSWIFYINIPVGLFAAGVTWAIYRTRETPVKRIPIDKVGLISLIAWVGSLQIMLDKGKDLDWFTSPVMAKIMPKSDARVLATMAFLGFAGVFFMRSLYTTGVDTWTLVVPTFLQGIPTALFFVPLTAIILSGLPGDKIPAAAGLSNFVRVFAGAVGTSLVATGWNDRTILHHTQLAEQTSVNNPNFVGSMNALQSTLGGSASQALAFFENSLNTQAAMLGLNDIFWLSAVIFIAIIPLIWLTKPSKGGSAAAAGAGGHRGFFARAGGRGLGSGVGVRLWRLGHGSEVGGRGECWVAAAHVSAGYMLAIFFIAISHCAWRHFISWSFGDKETKQRKRLPTEGELVSLACSPERRMFEPLLLANPDIPTLRHQ
jgi:hypothetical protein